MDPKYLQMTCEDCSYPPKFIFLTRKDDDGTTITCVSCRDCGEYWEEPNTGEE